MLALQQDMIAHKAYRQRHIAFGIGRRKAAAQVKRPDRIARLFYIRHKLHDFTYACNKRVYAENLTADMDMYALKVKILTLRHGFNHFKNCLPLVNGNAELAVNIRSDYILVCISLYARVYADNDGGFCFKLARCADNLVKLHFAVRYDCADAERNCLSYLIGVLLLP